MYLCGLVSSHKHRDSLPFLYDHRTKMSGMRDQPNVSQAVLTGFLWGLPGKSSGVCPPSALGCVVFVSWN